MIKNYFYIAWRSILREGSYSLINIFGLIAGFVAFLWITQYVLFEKSYDRHSDQYKSIYRVNLQRSSDGMPGTSTALNFPNTGPELARSFDG